MSEIKSSVIESSDYDFMQAHREEFDKIVSLLTSMENDFKIVIRFDDPKDEIVIQKGDWKL